MKKLKADTFFKAEKVSVTGAGNLKLPKKSPGGLPYKNDGGSRTCRTFPGVKIGQLVALRVL